MPTVQLNFGLLDYRTFGPENEGAPTAVFVHGFLVNGTLWDQVAERLAEIGIRSIVADWPLGAHSTPTNADANLSPTTISHAVLELLDSLGLDDVVLVGSDTGGGICQLALKGDHRRIGGLVLTNCDAFEVFPPKFFVPLFVAARFRAAVWAIGQTMRLRPLRHSPLAFGLLLSAPRSPSLTEGWVRPLLSSSRIRLDIIRFAKGIQRTELVHAASWLADFAKPTRLVWGTKDRLFTIEIARRLVAALPKATLVEIPNATTFVSIDRPDAVASAISAIAEEIRRAE